MKPSSFFLTLLVAALAHAVAVASGDNLTAEFLAWKRSPAGQAAYKNGHVPATQSSRFLAVADAETPPTTEELARFQAAKERVQTLQVEQPMATFSVNTPFALLSPGEFAEYVGRNDVQHHRALLEKHIGSDRFRNTTTSEFASRKLASMANVITVDWAAKGCDVISCGTNGQGTCSGGASVRACDWIAHINGGSICTDATFPYTSGSGQVPACPTSDPYFDCNKPDLGAYFYEAQRFADHTKLETAVLEHPVSALATTGVATFQYYAGGLIMGSEDACPSTKLDSAILIVGYGVLDGVAYWKIRNQWSTYWGEQGYAYVERGYQGASYGACGIETLAYYPVFARGSNAVLNLRCSAQRERVEILGATLKSVTTVKPQDCCDQCRQESGCKAYVWRYESDTCDLKSSITGEQVNAPGANPTYSGTVTSKDARVQQGTILNNVDFVGNDILSLRASTAEECMDKCNTLLKDRRRPGTSPSLDVNTPGTDAMVVQGPPPASPSRGEQEVFPAWIRERKDFQVFFPRFSDIVITGEEILRQGVPKDPGDRNTVELQCFARWIMEIPSMATSLDLSQATEIAKLVRYQALKPREYVFHKGDKGDACYLVFSGEVHVLVDGQKVATVGKNSAFGDIALQIENATRGADVQAGTGANVPVNTSTLARCQTRRYKHLINWLHTEVLLFRDCVESKLHYFELVSLDVPLKQGEILYRQGDSIGTFYIVRSGKVRLEVGIQYEHKHRWPVGRHEWKEQVHAAKSRVAFTLKERAGFFGFEMFVEGQQARAYTVIADSPTVELVGLNRVDCFSPYFSFTSRAIERIPEKHDKCRELATKQIHQKLKDFHRLTSAQKKTFNTTVEKEAPVSVKAKFNHSKETPQFQFPSLQPAKWEAPNDVVRALQLACQWQWC
ncbi:Cgmp-dependent protein kinase egl-4, partial [Globisporangium splendens]